MNWWRQILISLGLGLVVGTISATGASALAIPAAPPLDRPIVDQTNTLSEDDITRISSVIQQGRQERSYQLGVLVIASLENEALEDYSIKVARQWGIGTSKENNGVLLLIAKDDRRLRIEVGSGLEGGLTDARSGRIIRNTITPEFRKNNYAAGIEKGVVAIQEAVDNKPEANAAPTTEDKSNIVDMIAMGIFFGSFVLTWLAAILGRSKSWWAGGVLGGGIGLVISIISGFAVLSLIGLVVLVFGGLFFDYIVSKNYKKAVQSGSDGPSWWAGGGGWGGGSSWGGGGGFGGGGFSGGGSSGSW